MAPCARLKARGRLLQPDGDSDPGFPLERRASLAARRPGRDGERKGWVSIPQAGSRRTPRFRRGELNQLLSPSLGGPARRSDRTAAEGERVELSSRLITDVSLRTRWAQPRAHVLPRPTAAPGRRVERRERVSNPQGLAPQPVSNRCPHPVGFPPRVRARRWSHDEPGYCERRDWDSDPGAASVDDQLISNQPRLATPAPLPWGGASELIEPGASACA